MLALDRSGICIMLRQRVGCPRCCSPSNSCSREILAFTKKHEDLLISNSEGIQRNREGIQRNREGIQRLEVLMEDQKSAIDSILEVVMHTDARLRKQDELAATLDNHEHRISALETHTKRQ